MNELEQAKYNAWSQLRDRWMAEVGEDDRPELIRYLIGKLKELLPDE